MKIGIIGAMAEELRLLRHDMTDCQEWTEAGATFISGKLGDKEVVVVQSGIGKVLAAVTTTLLISHYQVDLVINTGSAGGIGTGLSIGDVVIADKLAYYDADVTAFGYDMGQMAGMPLYYEAAEELVAKAIEAAENRHLSTKVGLIVTGDTFVNKQEKITEIKGFFPEVLANEMEGAAIAHVAHQFKTPFVVIRAMSDVGDEEASVNFDEFILEAGRKSAEMTIALVGAL